MRISIVRGDPGYDPTHTRRVRRVTVDGLPVACATADEEQGFADEIVMEGGRVALDPTDGSPLTRRLVGRVRVELEPQDERRWDANRRLDGVRVQVGREPGTRDVLVQVFSWARPGAIKQGRIDALHQPSSAAEMCQRAGAVAGAMAEMLCDQFGDRMDPSEAARVAVEQCARLLSEEAAAGG